MSVLPPFARLLHRKIRRYCSGLPGALLRHPEGELQLDLDMVLSHFRLEHPQVTMLQIGAFDGISDDAIYPLVEKHALSGVLVEPQSDAFARLQANYARFAPRFKFVNAAIGACDGTVPLYRVRSGTQGPQWLHGIASLDKRVLLRHTKMFPQLEQYIDVQDVPCYSFATLFRHCGLDRVDLLQIDAEGHDLQVLRWFDVAARRPAIVRFEHKHLDRREYDGYVEMLIELGYRVAFRGFDTLAYLPS
jgi:FkbM family methyltransferase